MSSAKEAQVRTFESCWAGQMPSIIFKLKANPLGSIVPIVIQDHPDIGLKLGASFTMGNTEGLSLVGHERIRSFYTPVKNLFSLYRIFFKAY
jgi:hypothetical protein